MPKCCILNVLLPLSLGRKNKNGKRSNKSKFSSNSSLVALIEAREWFLVSDKLNNLSQQKDNVNEVDELNVEIPTATAPVFAPDTGDSAGSTSTSADKLDASTENNENHPTFFTDKSDNETLLHKILRYQPPVDIVQYIIKKYPHSIITTFTTKCKEYPLHIASSYGCHPDIIELLIEKFPKACMEVDADGRTPLHLVCMNYLSYYENNIVWMEKILDNNYGNNNNDEETSTQPILYNPEKAMFKTVRHLIQKNVQIVNINDDDDMTALEYAICNTTPLNVVQFIQKSAEHYLKDEKRRKSLTNTSLSSSLNDKSTVGDISGMIENVDDVEIIDGNNVVKANEVESLLNATSDDSNSNNQSKRDEIIVVKKV